MAIMTAQKNKLPVVSSENTQKFIRESNKNKLTAEFLQQCHESTVRFSRKNNGKKS